MRNFIAVLLLLSGCASAGDFSSRVEAGKAVAMATPEGKAYDASLVPAITASISACVTVGSTSTENLGKFTLVAYSNFSGQLSQIKVAPKTQTAQCFADKFATTQLPAPPLHSSSRFYPITVVMTVSP